ncbi:MAG: UDP-N-acetylmuramoyl-L-alanyl-D-glutamate--2,6-diaminopimelate ligase [Patescibacteria group bacterium]
MKKLIPQSIKNIYHLFQAVLANLWYSFPSRKIKVIGVTGTDGKTTTVQMIAKILEEAGKQMAVVSTINFKIKDRGWINKTKFTTLSAWSVQKFIKDAVKANCKYLVLETSSHSLDQYRIWGIKYDVAVITNATREHLDYHKTMEKYRKAKRLLFKNVNTAVVNLDMEEPEYYLSCNAKEKYGYTAREQESAISDQKIKFIQARDIKLDTNKSLFTVHCSLFTINLPGLFNIENALAATCVGLSQGISLEIIKNALEKIKGIPGRLESVPNSKGINIIVDFALTPNSLQRLYELIDNIRSNPQNIGFDPRVIAVFGACGERDRGKRPITGKIVSEHADYVIVTDDEPYHEDPKRIIEEISAGIKDKIEGENFWKIPDRREAIKKALTLARTGDFVVVTGMGSEDTRAVGDQKIPWNDKKIILEELNKLANC